MSATDSHRLFNLRLPPEFVRSYRIAAEPAIPFLFTKVLNVRDEPFSIRAQIMTHAHFQTYPDGGQSAAFVFGLLSGGCNGGGTPNTFILTFALALVIGSVCSLLIQWRALHDALIVGFPVVALGLSHG